MAGIDLGRIIVQAIIAVVGIILLRQLVLSVCLSAHEWSVARWLKRAGVEVDGTIVKLHMRRGGRSTLFYASYHFRAKDHHATAITKQQQISWRHAENLHHGQSVTVRYLPSTPIVARLAGEDRDNSTRDSTMIWAVFALIIFPPLVILWGVIALIKPVTIEKLVTRYLYR